MIIKIEFPFLPPSVNQCYATNWRTKRRFKSEVYESFIENCLPYMQGKIIKGEVEVEFNFYVPDKRRRDSSNLIKALEDTLVAYGVIEDDSLITRHVIEKIYDKGKPYTVIQIKRK